MKRWLIFLAFVLAFNGARYWYYGELVPNTATAKTQFSWESLDAGADYLGSFIQGPLVYGLLALPILWAAIANRKVRFGLLGVILGAWTAYTVGVGGDTLTSWRFFVPIWGLFAIAFSRSVQRIA